MRLGNYEQSSGQAMQAVAFQHRHWRAIIDQSANTELPKLAPETSEIVEKYTRSHLPWISYLGITCQNERAVIPILCPWRFAPA